MSTTEAGRFGSEEARGEQAGRQGWARLPGLKLFLCQGGPLRNGRQLEASECDRRAVRTLVSSWDCLYRVINNDHEGDLVVCEPLFSESYPIPSTAPYGLCIPELTNMHKSYLLIT